MSKRQTLGKSAGTLENLLADVTGVSTEEPLTSERRSSTTKPRLRKASPKAAAEKPRRAVKTARTQYSIRFPPKALEHIQATVREYKGSVVGLSINSLVVNGALRECERIRSGK